MNCTRLLALALGSALLCTGNARAAEHEDAAPTPDRNNQHEQHRDERREQARRRIETVRIARLTQELDLDAETAVQLVPLMKKEDELQRQQRQQRRQLRETAAREIQAGNADDARLEALVEEFWNQEEQFVEDRRDVFEDIAKVLTPEQQLRYIDFGPRFEREMRSIMRGIQRQHHGEDRRERHRDDRGPRGNGSGEREWWRDGPPADAPDSSRP